VSTARSIGGFRFPLQNYDEKKAINTNFRHLQDHLSRLQLESGQGPDIVIAPSDNPKPGRANVILPGGGDNVKIQEAIDTLEGDGGGWLHFLSGNILTSAEVNHTGSSSIKITGSGWNTIWKPSAAMTNVLNITGPDYCEVSDIKFDGNGQTTTYILQINASAHTKVNRVWVTGASGVGFRAGPASYEFVDCYASSNGGHGFEMYMDQYSRIVNNFSSSNGGDGFRLTLNAGDPGTVRGNFAISNTGHGFRDRQGNILLMGCVSEFNTAGNYEGSGIEVHNMDGNAHVSGDHSDVDHGTLLGLADDDHTQYVLDSILTTAGDIFYATGASTPVRLGIGTAGQGLVVNSGATAPEWADLVTDPIPLDFLLGGM
jgi:hypothetical protein